jgi:hypothetical protein
LKRYIRCHTQYHISYFVCVSPGPCSGIATVCVSNSICCTQVQVQVQVQVQDRYRLWSPAYACRRCGIAPGPAWRCSSRSARCTIRDPGRGPHVATFHLDRLVSVDAFLLHLHTPSPRERPHLQPIANVEVRGAARRDAHVGGGDHAATCAQMTRNTHRPHLLEALAPTKRAPLPRERRGGKRGLDEMEAMCAATSTA